MEYGIVDILKLLGSLVLFLYGMKLMSESLQKVAGDRMRSILAAMTSNKYKGILTGFLITAIIQSSSATTVMLVSFVNAGLVTLVESIGVIMGANIGTTVTAWLISILGFKVHMSQLVLPLMGIVLPLIFSKNRKRSNWGVVVIGFALIFIGLDFLKESTSGIDNNASFLTFISGFARFGYWSVLIYLAIGTIITMIIQSSSAVMALTLVMCFNGWLSFETAAAMVLGQNIGTTITANLAALIANTTAKRAARAHLLFNLIGVILVMIVFYPYCKLIGWITVHTGSFSPYPIASQTIEQTNGAIPIALSIFHTIFNIVNTLLLMWFIPILVRTVEYLVPQKEEDEEFKLEFINTGLLSTSELSLLQAKKETIILSERVDKMVLQVQRLMEETDVKKMDKISQKIKKNEEICDQFELEITRYLARIAEDSLSSESADRINKMLFIVSHLEEISDACYKMSNSLERKNEQKVVFGEESEANLKKLFELAKFELEEVIINIKSENGAKVNPESFTKARKVYEKLNKQLKKTRNDHYKSIKKKVYKCKDGLILSDLYAELAKIGHLAYEINEAIYEIEEEPVVV
ncbi:MAG: Na/Pi cotransporter family protein [Bacteroidales bacterium]|nr:Na/Pi cotransporter family protein [Bacteroidales bacterium]